MWSLLLTLAALTSDDLPLSPKVITEPVSKDADDPAVWIHPSEADKSLILGTDKVAQEGGLFVFNLEGKVVQRIQGLDRPNNVDVDYGFSLDGKTVDIAVVTERHKKRLKIYAIDRSSGQLSDVSGETGVFLDRDDENAVPMGIGIYRRPMDGAFFAVVSPKGGPKDGYLGVFELIAKDGKIDTKPVGSFGRFSGEGEIEAICVDDELGFVYFSDEGAGLRKAVIDPASPAFGQELAIFGTEGYQGDREGLAIYDSTHGRGWLLSSDQIQGGSRLFVYDRLGANTKVTVVPTVADSTDGIEVVARPMGEKFPEGFVVMMNSKDQNFMLFDWRDVRRAFPGF
jgi:3-phytase